MKKLKNIIEKYKKIISNFKYKKNIRKEKSKLYVQENWAKYKSKRNKFKIFTSKLEFENTFSDIKKINVYYYIIWLFLIVSSFYVLFLSHYFSVKSIDIIRNDELINIDLSYKSVENFRYKPILFVDKNDIKLNLLSHQPNIKNIVIRKIMPDKIKIVIEWFESVFETEFDGKIYQITSNWVIIPSKSKENSQKIKIIWLNNLWIIDYKKIFKDTYISKIQNIIELIKLKNSFITINDIIYYQKEAELHIIDQNWTTIIFDLAKEENIQIEKLNIFHKKYVNQIKFWVIYLDLRINEKIIYCARDNEFQCKQNLKSIYE